MTTVSFIVDGITCDGCVSSIRRALTAIDGVQSVDVKQENGEVTIEYDPQRAGTSSLQNAIRGAGYEVS
ncbi:MULTISPECIES: heavy-metal-associated domain-containing protein [Acetobacter]|uniref:Heavy-metal-associated domain-containing protein n=1 Tax=Acetobacter thailandicus TaxID=1502842 RepID=A0ABT3QBT1_9PROT|nr:MULTISPECIES: heavy-metal-associated domain-containing protein [Acetobacter]MBS0959071.1 heavy-metal-associated domain-containing protein [Acetobacter thailandicus]MBS0980425.1 heavy-metal-associated domain-containing protein [Acetobacter thailandicus]MBS0985042.1 heavy-metal-associated domain-containing protein [Acetobacter thailandicus]MBS1003419.1 heavy-metal-associated domain-containing protein [Acetobacter thailandicus]MCX2562747.1 heavy-metal-associated domain-containing protein [Acet